MTAPAYAGTGAWTISSASSPTRFAAGDETGEDMYILTVVNSGVGSTDGSRIEIADTLPEGLVASSISGIDLGNGQVLACRSTPTLDCSYEGFRVAPGDVLQIEIGVKVNSVIAPSVVNSATVTSGGAGVDASAEDPTTISDTAAGFGIDNFATTWSGIQAGAAVNLTATLAFNQIVSGGETVPAMDAKEVVMRLPPGFVANPNAIPRCSWSDAENDTCPADTAVGVVFTSSGSGTGGAPTPYSSLVYNTAPAPGAPGALTFMLPSGPLRLGLEIRADGDYELGVSANALPEIDPLISMTLTLWGVPGAYNGSGPSPDHVLSGSAPPFGSPGIATARFLTSAGACGTTPSSTVSVDAWTAPAVLHEASSMSPPLTGCNRLPFAPSLSVAPDVSEADEPSGYEIDLRIPQSENPDGLASATLRDAAVTLPAGTALSLSAADGLQACSEAQVGLGSSAPPICPEASKIGRITIETPLSAHTLEGAAYLARPTENPFGSLLALYMVAEDPTSGVLVKLAGQLEPNPFTGQLTIVLRELPQLPIGGMHLHFFGGPRALLTSPATCGLATSTSDLTPWSGNTDVVVSSDFEVDSGPNGTPCSQSRPFSPAFQAGSTTTDEVDAYGSLTLLVTRVDREEQLGTIAIQAPPAVAQMFAGVPPCEEPQAAQGTCPAASEVGTVAAQAGLGFDPASLNGTVYLTGPYGGAPRGLSIELPITPGPFELGTVVVRASEQIDPQTGRMTIASDRLPSVADGVPLQLKALELQLERGEFRINPDGCEPLTVTGTITSTQGTSVKISTEPLGASASPCPPHQAPPPAATPQAGDVSSSANVSLAGTRIVTTSGREAVVKLTCRGTGTCRGKLTLTIRTKGKRGKKRRSKMTRIGMAAFSVPPGKTTAVELKLDPVARTLLRANGGRLGATLTIFKLSPAPSQTHTETVQLVKKRAANARRPRH